MALVPETVARLAKSGVGVCVQSGAGDAAAFPDDLYEKAGATLARDLQSLLPRADVLVTVGRPSEEMLQRLRSGVVVVGFLNPLGDPEYLKRLAQVKLTAIAMELIPRITRAQSMDALSSQSNIAGYKGVLLAAATLPKFFPMLTTAAGTIAPAKVLVLGAGVASLQAIATARRLGATAMRLDGPEALAIGLADRVVRDGAMLDIAVREICNQVLKCAPEAVAVTKRLMLRAAGSDVVAELLDGSGLRQVGDGSGPRLQARVAPQPHQRRGLSCLRNAWVEKGEDAAERDVGWLGEGQEERVL